MSSKAWAVFISLSVMVFLVLATTVALRHLIPDARKRLPLQIFASFCIGSFMGQVMLLLTT